MVLTKQQGRGGIFFFSFLAGGHASAMPAETPNLSLWVWTTTCATTAPGQATPVPGLRKAGSSGYLCFPGAVLAAQGDARAEAVALCTF